MNAPRSPRKRLLLVSYHAPHTDLPPSRRVGAIAAALESRGVEVDVLTTAFFGRNGDSSIATPDLRTIVARSRRHPVGEEPAATFERGRLSRVVPPDVTAATWLPTALPRALARHRRDPYDAVLTTSPPESPHLVGAALRSRGARWIADLRDGWTFESPVPRSYWPGFEERLERRLLGRADALVAATEPIAADLRRRIPHARVIRLENVFDPDTPVEEPPFALDPSRFSLVYTGTGAADGKDAGPFLAALALVLSRRPELAERIEVVFAGSFLPVELEAMAAEPLRRVVRFAGRLPHPQALGLQHAADGLLLILSPGTVGVTTGKVFEYLAAAKPILTVGAGAGADLVASAGPHAVASDPARLSEAVEAYLDRWIGGEPFEPAPGFDPRLYTPARSAEALLDLLERLDGHAG